MSALRVYAGFPFRVLFSFRDEQGNPVTNLNSPVASLYSCYNGQEIDSNLPLTLSGDYYELIYTADSSLQGTYYFFATGRDNRGIQRFSTVFVDILPPSATLQYIDFDTAIKYIDDKNIDYSILPLLIQTATEWVEDQLGYKITPQTTSEKCRVFGNKVYLSKYPLLEVISVTDTFGNTLSDYTVVNANAGVIEIRGIIPTEVIIEYKYGFYPIPQTIYTAIAMVVGCLYDKMKYQNYNVIRMADLSATLDKDVLSKVKEILEPFIKHV